MSLRFRLTLLYSSLLGGALLIFGALVYGLVRVALLQQVDDQLTQAAEQVIPLLRVGENGRFDTRSIIGFQPVENLYLQVWGLQRDLQLSLPLGLQTPLDERALWITVPTFTSAQGSLGHLRVLSVPLVSEHGEVGVLQLATRLLLVDITLNTLSTTVAMLAALVVLVSALISWLIIGHALAPLETMTRIATQVTRADDLQRRIPLQGSAEDEVGQLIQAFNQTLERLEKLFSTQRRFLADVSHELRTPLTVIKGNVGLLRRLGGADSEALDSIEQEVDRLTRLVGDLLLLAQAESGRLPLAQQPVALDEVLMDVYQQMKLLAGERITLKLTEIDQLQVLGDRDRLKQVMLNLVSNAVQYTPAGGQVTLALRRASNRAQFVVSDSGPGIPPEDLPHIFERFYRGEKSRRRSQATGFGLGLSIAYWIVRNHGGVIDVASREGVGTTFTVWLPLIEAGNEPKQDKK